MTGSDEDHAARLIAVHGRRAAQHVIDEIQAAIRRGDDAATLARLGACLDDIERHLEDRAAGNGAAPSP